MSSVATRPDAGLDLRARRRAARRAENRMEILDAAERVFGRRGLRDGSLREIAALSGSSAAAIYLFFDARPDFRRLLRYITGGTAIVRPALAEYATAVDGHFMDAMALIAGVVSDGQATGTVRDGDAFALAHLYSVLINEHVLLGVEGESSAGTLTGEQFHGVIDGVLRNPR